MICSAYDLKEFYRDFKGRVIRSVIRDKILELWPDGEITNKNIVGYGYSVPYLPPFMMQEDNNRVSAMMPSQMGVHQWPENGLNVCAIHNEGTLPLETNSIDMMIMVHALEFLESPQETFEEIWRVLKSTGRLIVIVPNRMGFWARADWSPFGQGQPYSASQVEKLLKDSLFVHEKTCNALFIPAFQKNIIIRTAQLFEKIGRVLYPALGGVHVIEASKQIYATRQKGKGVPTHLETKRAVKAKPVVSPHTTN